MRIYHKKNFVSGLAMVGLGALNLAGGFWTGMDWGRVVLVAALLLFGGGLAAPAVVLPRGRLGRGLLPGGGGGLLRLRRFGGGLLGSGLRSLAAPAAPTAGGRADAGGLGMFIVGHSVIFLSNSQKRGGSLSPPGCGTRCNISFPLHGPC